VAEALSEVRAPTDRKAERLRVEATAGPTFGDTRLDVAQEVDVIGSSVWHDYPADVPPGSRWPCSVSDCHATAVLVETFKPYAKYDTPTRDPRDAVRPYCQPHAVEAGWERPAQPIPAAHLNMFQRWVVKELSRSTTSSSEGHS
jgi:hypothetical protein